MKYLPTLLFAILLMASCQETEPRRPLEIKRGSFLKLSAERNKKLLQFEDSLMLELIRMDTLHGYQESSAGFRYYYDRQMPPDGPVPGTDDLVTLTYDLRTWNEDTIYSREEIGLLRYRVDKQELFPGLRYSVKLLREGETATFLYPSSLAFGYPGDKDRIGPNVPLKCTVSILDIEQQSTNNN